MTAGPTPLPPAVSQVMAEPILYHRAPAFVEIYARVLERLKMVFQTENEVLLVRRLGHRRDGVGGREPDRARRRRGGRLLRQVRAALGRAVRRLRRRDRATSRPSGARRSTRPRSTGARRARAARSKALFTTQSETSTGVVNDVRALAEVARRARRRDRRSTPSPASAWSTCRPTSGASTWSSSGSQKALMCPPGLAFASVSERALDGRRRRARARRAQLLLRLGARPSRASARTRPTARSRRRSRSSGRSTWRSS